MEKTLTYEEYVRVKNYLTKIKTLMELIDETKLEINKTVDKINEDLTIKYDENKD